MDPKTALEPGVVIADRFRVDETITFEGAGPAFLATDLETEGRLLVFETTLAEADALRPGVAVSHPHLATVAGLVAHGERDVLLAQHEPGLSLLAFTGSGALSKVDAVRFALRMLDAVQALHQAGSAHGFLHPAAVVMEPEDRPRPVVAFAPAAIGPSAFRSPERGESGAPSVGDDAWAAGALLYRMLLGTDPPAKGLATEDDLASAGVDDPVLRAALFHALCSDASRRSENLQPLRRELARWFAEHAGDGSSHSSTMGRPPPPLPANITGPSASRPPPAPISGAPPLSKSMATELTPRKKSSGPLIFAAVAAVLGLGAAWGVSAWRSRPKVTVITTSAPREAPAPAAPSAVSLGEVAVTGESEGDGGVDRSLSCVAANFPKDTFKKAPDLRWLCAESDPRAGGEKLRIAVVQGAAGGAPSEAQQLFSRLGWHEMSAFGVFHAACCNEPQALSLPEPSPGCDPLVKAIDAIAKAVTAKQPIDDALAAFGKAARCETDAKKAAQYRRTQAPQPSEDAALKDLLKSVSAP
ncbi:MAG: hypothetical protein IT377_03055 [Polyangiaceae bacterium]|nr:hypothetical protein [Polyangiaceae bacterium]